MPVLLRDVPHPLRRYVAGVRADDAVRVAGELVAEGRLVALEHAPGSADDPAAEFAGLIGRVRAAGLAGSCELSVPVDRLGRATALDVARRAAEAGIGVVLTGPPAETDALAGQLPGAGVAVGTADAEAEARCRRLGEGHVRLSAGRGRGGALAFVRCLNVLMAAGGRPAVATTDPRLIAIAGERAAGNGRTPDSWEHVMPYGVRTAEQHRLAAAGLSVRVSVPSGRGAAGALLRSLAGRS